jgi:drug/metabolite transporter (DMT)-like permease
MNDNIGKIDDDVPSAAIAPARRLGEDGLAPPPAALRMTGRATIADWWGGASNNLRGSIILLVAIASFTAMTVLIKVAGQRIPLVEILTVRQLVMQLLIAPFSVADFPAVLRTRDPFLQIGRGLLQLGAMLCSFAAVIYLPLALSMALSFSYALFVTVGAGLLLKETVGLGRWIATAVGLAGVAVMLQPAGDASLTYSLVAILGAVFAAASAVSLRAVSGFERADTILTYQALVLLTALAIPTALVWVTPTFGELIILLAVGVSGTLGQWLLTVAYKRGEAAALAPLDFVRLLLTAACGFVLFGESLEISELAGAVILIAATAYTFRVNARRIRRVPLPGRSAVN